MNNSKPNPIIVLGAGLAGIGAARELVDNDQPLCVLEQQDGPGGLVRTDVVDDYLFDRAGHFIHIRDERFRDVIENCNVAMSSYQRRAAVVINERFIPYPLQYNLWACDDALRSKVAQELSALPADVPTDLELHDTLLATWGQTLTDVFFRPYMEKMWGQALDAIPPDWGARFVPVREAEQLRAGLQGENKAFGYNAEFQYPASGRIGDLSAALASVTESSVLYNTAVTAIDSANRVVTLSDGSTLEYEHLISSLPLNRLVALLGRDDASDYFAHSNLLNVRVGFSGELHRDEHWLYLPEESLTAFRVGFPENFSDRVCPAGSHSLSLEVGLGPLKECSSAADIAQESLDYLQQCGALTCDAVEVVDAYLISPAYVAHRLPVTPVLQELERDLQAEQIHLCGRYGGWDYSSMEDAYLSGADAALRVLAAESGTNQKARRVG